MIVVVMVVVAIMTGGVDLFVADVVVVVGRGRGVTGVGRDGRRGRRRRGNVPVLL